MAAGNKPHRVESSFSTLLTSEIPWEQQTPIWETQCWGHITLGLCLLCPLADSFTGILLWNVHWQHKPFSPCETSFLTRKDLLCCQWDVLRPQLDNHGMSCNVPFVQKYSHLCFRLNLPEQDSFFSLGLCLEIYGCILRAFGYSIIYCTWFVQGHRILGTFHCTTMDEHETQVEGMWF